MTDRERFHAIMDGRPFDRVPLYFFGTWPETKVRWEREGLTGATDWPGSEGPQLPEMDADWACTPDRRGTIWNNQGLINPAPIPDRRGEMVEDTEEYRLWRTPFGGLVKHSKLGSTLPQHLEPDLHPTQEDWQRFREYLNPTDPRRRTGDWENRAEALRNRTRVSCFLGGSLFGYLRNWMGLEAISYLPYDNPELLHTMVDDLVDYFIRLNGQFLENVPFDFAYIFEDCCFANGPLFSPAVYEEFFDAGYRRLIAAYRNQGVPFMLMDSDGKVDTLIPHWLQSGFDIVFPLEVGTWKADPVELRSRFGTKLRIMGGVDKHVIPKGETAIRRELETLRPVVRKGGMIPFPDHRIPPDCSLQDFRTYCRVFREVFPG